MKSVNGSKQEERLIARGVMLPPRKKRRPSKSWPKPPGNIPDKIIGQVWREERENR